MRRIKLKWKIWFVIGLVVAAIAVMITLIALDNANDSGSGDPGSSETGGKPGVHLPTVDIPLG
ncbi:MAG: hypothetical protein J6K14_06905 [Clostridia bacterium]|nr:hypothetical protein [Clostridia bacterium]